ncbi:unnamed protein product [Ostreobium quekettii]|uniref:Uncharacterized protein n=1 Tax=Ostreobium quekettii TaxID=121088 RepID=A0A8S1JDK4_9CHLO|nr:unnamed protein product [Ostreobium quekettii]
MAAGSCDIGLCGWKIHYFLRGGCPPAGASFDGGDKCWCNTGAHDENGGKRGIGSCFHRGSHAWNDRYTAKFGPSGLWLGTMRLPCVTLDGSCGVDYSQLPAAAVGAAEACRVHIL